MTNTYSPDGKKIYSVDMMFAYVNIFTPKTISVKISDFTNKLDDNYWGNPNKKGNKISPLMVLNNPSKYKKHMKRIKKANFKYPIMMYNNKLIDGMHRIIKAKLNNKKTIKAYNFKKDIFKKFLINSKGEWSKVDKINSHELIEMFYKNFVKK